MTNLLHPRSSALAAASLLVLGASCGSSSTPKDDQGPGAGGELPPTFSVFLSDRGPNGMLRPVFYDPEAGTSRGLGGSLGADERIIEPATSMTADGRFMAVTTVEGSNTRLRFVNTRTGGATQVSFGGSGGGNQARGLEAPQVIFSPDSRRAIIQYEFDSVAITDASGAGRRNLPSGAVRRIAWLPSSDRFAARTSDPTTFYDRVTIYEGDTLAATHYVPIPGNELDVDRILFSRDESTLVAVGALENAEDEVAISAIDLVTGDRASWTFEFADEDAVVVSDNGAFVAVVTEDGTAAGAQVWICEVATTTAERVLFPSSHSMEPRIEDIMFEPNGTRLAIVSDHRVEDMEEVTMAGFNQTPFTVEPNVPMGAGVERAQWAPGGRWLVYQREDPASSTSTLLAFDADGTAMPQQLGDGSQGLPLSGLYFSPDGETLLTTQINLIAELGAAVLFDVGEWSTPTTLTDSIFTGSPTSADLLRGNTRAAFSRDGRSLYWLVSRAPTEPDQIRWLSLDGSAGTVPTTFVGTIAGGTTPFIDGLWAR